MYFQGCGGGGSRRRRHLHSEGGAENLMLQISVEMREGRRGGLRATEGRDGLDPDWIDETRSFRRRWRTEETTSHVVGSRWFHGSPCSVLRGKEDFFPPSSFCTKQIP